MRVDEASASVKEVAQVDIATRFKAAAQPTIPNIQAGAGKLNAATREAAGRQEAGEA
jgi:hypothetical protein